MIKRTLLAAAIFSALPAYAGLTSITAGYDFTDYSGDHGNRNLAYAELVAKVENATLLFNLSQGRRDYETEHFNATRGQGAVWYKWNNWLTTRTGIAFADNTPVFARQDFRQDINLALLPKTLFTTGYRYTKYYDDVEVDAWQGGVSLYTGPVITSYRYTHYDSSDAGGSYSNMISVRLNDPRGTGYTQLWLSRGTGAYTYDWTPETRYGSMKSVSLQRIQPLTEQLNLGLTAGKVWYDTPTDDFNGLQLAARLTWKFRFLLPPAIRGGLPCRLAPPPFLFVFRPHSPDKFYSPVLYTIGGYALTYRIPPYSILHADDEVRNAQYSGREEKGPYSSSSYSGAD
ncbi:outer membrane protein [Escherichia coli]|jgi:YaiO family outer membrane protein|nr:putative acyl transferase domain protein [Escherichia coli 2-474-04_S1_C1]GCP20229.1 hypothetical protein ExPECSC043_01266 [Escherichia coli]SQZ22682.1 outer membrane protein [Escherichia coli]